jgi:hypothetical protein
MNPLQITFGALLAAALLVTVVGYGRKYGALSGRSRLFRTAGMGLIDLLLVVGLILVSGNREAALAAGTLNAFAVRQLVLLTVVVFLTLSLIGVAALDALENVTVYRRERRQAMQDMIRAEIEAQAQKRADRQTGEGAAS